MKKAWKVLLSAALCAALLAGCGGGSSTSVLDKSQAAVEESSQGSAEGGSGWSGDAAPGDMPQVDNAANQPAGSQRKLIHNAWLRLESKEYDKTRSKLMEAVKKTNGFVEASSEEGSAEQGGRWAEYTLRIPSSNYSAFLQQAEDAGSLISKEENVDDVTRKYVDVQARLESLRVQETRLLELAQQAANMEDLLTIESKLSEVRYEIENYTMQQRTMDDQVDYSTVTVTLNEVTVYTPVAHSFSNRMREAFGDSWDRFVSGWQNFVIFVIYLLPNLILAAVVLVVVLLIVKKTSPARQRRKQKKQATAAMAAAPVINKAAKAPQTTQTPSGSDASYQALYTENKKDQK